MVTQTIDVNLVPGISSPMVHVSQYDIGREIEFNLYNGIEAYTPASGTVVTCEGTQSDLTGFSVSTTWSGNVVSLTITAEMTDAVGISRCELVLRHGDDRVGTANFIMDIEEAGVSNNTEFSPAQIAYVADALTHIGSVDSWVSRVEANEDAIEALETSVSGIETDVDSVENRVTTLEASMTQAESDIDTLENNLGNSVTSLTSRIATNTESIAVLDSRMDEFTALTDGSTTGDAELADIRVGSDGTTYSTAGDAVRGQVADLKSDLNELSEATIAEVDQVETMSLMQEVTIDGWEAETAHGYGYIMSDFFPTSLADKVFVYDTSTYRAYINYYDDTHVRTTYTYIGNDNQYAINKDYPYFKVWVYNTDQSSTDSAATVTANLRIEKQREVANVAIDAHNIADNVLDYDGHWTNDLSIIIGGYSLASSRVGAQIFANASLSRARTTNALYIRHDNAIVRTGYDNAYPFMWAKVDENDILLSYGGYVKTAILGEGKYYFLFRNSSGSPITSDILTALKNAVFCYGYFDDNAQKIDYSNLFCGNWYAEINGVVSLGDATWYSSATMTTVVIPPFYTDHDIYIKNTNTAYKWRDSVSDSSNNTIYTTGYVTSDSLTRIPSGYHHIMVARNTASTADLDAMSEVLEIYATKAEVASVAPESVVDRNMDAQNLLDAIRKPDKYNNGDNRTVFLAHATDSHGDYLRWMNFLQVVDHYQPALVVHTGDMVKNDMLSDTRHFLNNLPSMPTLLAMGNHEVGAGHDIGSGGATNATLFNDLIVPLNEKYGLGATKTYYSYTTNSLQYTGGVKFIVLNVYDYDANDGTNFTDREHIYYSQDQITWLISELQDAITNNNPVVICAHECDAYLAPADGGEIPFNQTYERATLYSKTWTGNPVCDLIEAFINGTSISQTYTETGAGITLTVSTSFASHGHFVCWLVGHRHADFMGFLPDYSQLVISPCATACSIGSANSTQGYSDLPRREGDRCEDAFNLYAITPDAKTIGIVRIGSNVNYNLRARDAYVASYTN